MNNLKTFFLILSIGGIQTVNGSEIDNNNNSYLSTLNRIQHTKRNPRIVGGVDTELNEIPFIVSLTRRGGHFCGATILNEKWVLTAGHCLCNGFNQFLKPTNIKGVVGLHKISNFQKTTAYNSPNSPFEIDFKNILIHPDYKCNNHLNDIALLEISKPIKFNKQIQSLCILNNENNTRIYDNLIATVYGWGWTNENQEIGNRADTLQKANVMIWNNEICEKSYENHGKNNLISKTQICAGYENGGIDSCWADSGGPLLIDNSLVGIVSTGVGCGRPGLPGLYTRVSQYTKWIESITKL